MILKNSSYTVKSILLNNQKREVKIRSIAQNVIVKKGQIGEYTRAYITISRSLTF